MPAIKDIHVKSRTGTGIGNAFLGTIYPSEGGRGRQKFHFLDPVIFFSVFLKQTQCIQNGAIELTCPEHQGAVHHMQIGPAVIQFAQSGMNNT